MNTPPPEITDPLLKSLSEDALDLPRMAAREARRVHEHKRSPRAGSSRHFRPLAGLVWLMQFRAAQAAVALLILAAMIEGGSMITGERPPGGIWSVSDLTDTKTYDAQANARMLADESQNLVIGQIRQGSTGTNWVAAQTAGVDTYNIASGTDPMTAFDRVIAFNSTVGGTSSPVLTPAVIERSKFFLTANSKSPEQNLFKELNFNYSLGTGNIGNIQYSGGNTVSPTTTFPFSNIVGGGQITSGLRSGTLINSKAGTTSVLDSGIASVTFKGDRNGADGTVDVLTGSGTIAGNVNPAGEEGDWDSGAGLPSQTGQGQTVPIVEGFQPNPSLAGITFSGGTTQYSIATGPNTNNILGVTNGSGTFAGKINNGFGFVSGTNTISSTAADGRVAAINQGESKIGGPIVSHPWETMTFRPAKPLILAQQTGAVKPGEQTPAPAQPATPAPADARKLIRNAALDFEVTSFESALDTVGKVAGEEQGYILTQNSAKGENGKLQGQIIVKVLPGNLDRFLLKLRALGDMKNQTVGGNDVTKDYYDTEARIRNSQVTEARLVEMMKTRTGKVSDLLEVENEIAKVRGEIEQMQGQLKYYDGLVQYATVTITLQEKDINQAAAYLLTQRAQLSLFAKDVDAALAEAKTDADAAKAQTLDSHIERNESGQEVATLHLLLPPENADAAIMKLKAIGRIQNFNSQTQRVAKDAGDDAAPSDTAKVDRDKVDISILIQRDAENPVQGTNISVQTDQVDEKTRQIKEAAAAVGVEVKGAEFNRMHNGVEISAMLLRMPMKKYAAFIEQIKSLGKVKDFTVARREDSTATDDAPAEIVLQIFSQGNIVAPDTGLWVTVRHTLGEGMSALMWSLRMIGVSLAWIAPWAVIAGLVGWEMARRRRRAAKKQG